MTEPTLLSTQTLLAYLVAAGFFIVGLKRLNSPATARLGNTISGIGMAIAVIATLLDKKVVTYGTIAAGLVVGGAVGLFMARRAKMTEMPQLVALLHGIGSLAALIVAGAEYIRVAQAHDQMALASGIATQVSIAIGGFTFSGSIIAFAKLHEIMTGKPILFPGMRFVTGLTLLGIIVFGYAQVHAFAAPLDVFYGAVGLSLLLGVLFVLPIGGADMPVVISVLNSSAGVAAAMVGFVIQNPILILSGSLIGSAGIILSQIMCRAMNRSLTNVLFSAFGTATAKSAKSSAGLTVKSITPEDAAMQLAYAQLVIVVPGYGLAVAQAQHLVRELGDLIEKRGGEVRYAVHPVAGRMPGHMNVVLAEANVAYDKLFEMEAINDEFDRADVALVVGANDVVNPAARTDPTSPIYGMPILNADHAKSCIVLKRGMSAGFAGIENELFYAGKTWMLFGDAKASLTKLVAEIKGIA
ncbi:MAG TPA: NAD(P)(+) transhydrogenase (Re/Si-specific) subunit beta [Gemmatimonadaceae bacterium]|nr:NAD(P)(+) transhydrogenase (Re/Si-specific) subunit beta [Gemmatimonadaceae bacterium]